MSKFPPAPAVAASPIKSIQRGTINLPGTSAIATVSAVVMAKSFLSLLGNDMNDSGADEQDSAVKIILTNTTTVTASRVTNLGTPLTSFVLVEYV